MISFEEFQRLDIRVGTVIKAEVPAWSHWVMKLVVDFGPSFAKTSEGRKTRNCFSGIMKFFSPKVFVGKQFPFVVNLEPKKIGPEKDFSEVMMVMACPGGDDNDVAPVLFKLPKKVPNGTRVY